MYIERQRNKLFEKDVEDIIKNPPMRCFLHDDYKWSLKRLFRSYALVNNRKEAEAYIRNWPYWTKWEKFMRKEYSACMDILNLSHGVTMYINPLQGEILFNHMNGMYK